MDLIHPETKIDVVNAMRRASNDGVRVLIVGGRRHLDKGNPSDVDTELWTTQLDRVISYEPAEMIAVVEAGIRVGALSDLLAEGGQEWPVDAPRDATVGGVIAAGMSSPRRSRVGHVRDTVVEMEVVTGDGRLVRSGARTVKNVTGYDVHKLLVGSLGTLGVIVQVALKLRPLPAAGRSVTLAGGLDAGDAALDAVPNASSVISAPATTDVLLQGWPEEVADAEARLSSTAEILRARDADAFPVDEPWGDGRVVVEVAVPPSRLRDVVEPLGGGWHALVGVGIAWVGLSSADGELSGLRARVSSLGGIAPVIRGPGGLGPSPVPAVEVQRRIRSAFDPASVLAPGRGWV
jgi:glycolate oxidase FAD binding subunit